MKILGRMNSRTVMMERFQDAEFSRHCCPQKTVTIPRIVCVLYLLFTQPSLIRSFHSSDPCFSVSCQRGSDMRGSTVVHSRVAERLPSICRQTDRQRYDKYKTHLRQSHSLSAHFLLHSDVNTSLFGKNTDTGDRQ